MNIETLHQLFLKYSSVCTDTRTIKKNDIFFALKGALFNGNKFAKNALKKGAKYAIVDDKEYAINSNYILVDDVLKTLQQLAKYHRTYLNIKIIALTGSNGKTTTKDLINSVLKKKYKTVATKSNLNNHIGVPLTLLSMDATTEIGIIEMGANHLKEIEFLCNIANPDFGYITNFGKAHLEGFGTIEGVIKGKSELYNHLKQNNKLIYINAEDDLQLKQLYDYKNYYSFGSSSKENATIEFLEANPFVHVEYNNIKISSKLIGKYNFSNISAAIAIGNNFNVSDIDIKSAIEAYSPENNRSQIIKKDSNNILLDAYNANPTSMEAALDSFSNIINDNKIAILGDMFELGQDAAKEHQYIAEYLLQLNIDKTYLVGQNFHATIVNSTSIQQFKSFEGLKEAIVKSDFKNSSFLIKGSRSMALERILDFI
ncbi:UDP-N-acetylmuramoyl-tripeptide--D-alanyl-D-alanine ligase [Flavobacteriaceae bacterium AH-315-B10]|nr:UDP-N-acetylmuramoyl-tripeptide--D-alanyl-D-alanine ligase [Flavobacteriaceae bacterium AH-315-B10]